MFLIQFLFQVLSACVAVSSAQLVAYHNGAVVPVDTAEVQAAKAAHAAAGGAVHHALPLGLGYYAGYPYAVAGLPAFGGLVGHANGAVVPVDEPAVAAAKIAHAAAGGAVHPAAGLALHPAVAPTAFAGLAGYPYPGFANLVAAPAAVAPVAPALAPLAELVAHPNGALVPVEPAEVVAARAEHLAAHA